MLIGMIAATTILLRVSNRLTGTPMYRDSLEVASSSPEVRRVLGDNIKAKWPPLGFDSSSYSSEFAEWSAKLEGPLGSGHLYAVANRVYGWWEYSRLVFVSDDGKTKVDLDKNLRHIPLPDVPAQKVYLIPLGLSTGETLDWAPAYYKEKFGIDVTVLQPLSWNASLEDSARRQLDAAHAISYLAQSHPEIASDPYSILIGVTSKDMYTPYYNWQYLTNWRDEGRFAIVSTHRLHPVSWLAKWNPEWFNSRIQKLLTKNIALLYFNLPLSRDPSSLLSSGILTGFDLDQMGGQIIGVNRSWTSAINAGSPGLVVYDEPGKPVLWRREYLDRQIQETAAQTFNTDLSDGLFIQRKVDFSLDEAYPFQFIRAYTTHDDRSRGFGIGAEHSLNLILTGQMGFAVDLSFEDGAKIHFAHAKPQPGRGDMYIEPGDSNTPDTRAQATFDGRVWTVVTRDRWTYFFPYQPKWLPQYTTVLTSFKDPSGALYKMERDEFGVLTSITTPTGKWLRFENDKQHRVRRIDSSTGRFVRYEYDSGGRLARVSDSDGRVDGYAYDEKSQMIAAAHGDGPPVLTMRYTNDGYVNSQTLANGRKFEITYFRGDRNVTTEAFVVDPRGLQTLFDLGPRGYTQSLSEPPPR